MCSLRHIQEIARAIEARYLESLGALRLEVLQPSPVAAEAKNAATSGVIAVPFCQCYDATPSLCVRYSTARPNVARLG